MGGNLLNRLQFCNCISQQSIGQSAVAIDAIILGSRPRMRRLWRTLRRASSATCGRSIRRVGPGGWVDKDAKKVQLHRQFSSCGDRGLVTVFEPTPAYFVRGKRKKRGAVHLSRVSVRHRTRTARGTCFPPKMWTKPPKRGLGSTSAEPVYQQLIQAK